MSLLGKLDLDTLNASRLWQQLDTATRTEAARALYTLEEGGKAGHAAGADSAIARAIRFRDKSVRKLPIERRVGYLATTVRPEETLATLLLQALHLKLRKPLLTSFLDDLGIEHEDGNIKDSESPATKTAEQVTAAARKLYETCLAPEVDVYLASLHAFEPDGWPGLRDLLVERSRT